MSSAGACPSLSLSQFFKNWQKIRLPAYTPFFSFQESENIQNDTKLAKNLNVFAKNGHFFGLFTLGGVGPSRLGCPP